MFPLQATKSSMQGYSAVKERNFKIIYCRFKVLDCVAHKRLEIVLT